MNSFLKWAGSKRKILSHLTELAPAAFDRYVEPFAGSACFFFSLEPKKALLSDINDELIATFKEIKDNTEDLIRELSGMTCSKEAYYAERDMDPRELSKTRETLI